MRRRAGDAEAPADQLPACAIGAQRPACAIGAQRPEQLGVLGFERVQAAAMAAAGWSWRTARLRRPAPLRQPVSVGVL